MKATTLAVLCLIAALALLLPGGARSAPQGNVELENLNVPFQTGGLCSPRLNSDLALSGRVSGQVVTAQGPAGANLHVQLHLPDGTVVRETRTDEQGGYHFSKLPDGRYQLRVVDENGRLLALQANVSLDIRPEQGQIPIESVLHLAASVPDRALQSAGLPIATARSEQPASVQANGYITGVVTAANTGQPVFTYVQVYSNSGSLQTSGMTGFSTGRYSITVPSGVYRVKFEPVFSSDGYAPEWHNNQRDFASAAQIVVGDGALVTNINAVLEVGGKIAGRVTAAAGGMPLQNVYVYAYTSTTSTSYQAYDSTDASGIYTITGLLSGSYYLKFDPPFGSDYLIEYYNNQRTLAAANDISVALSGVVPGIDAALDVGGKIAGRVTAAAGGTPLQNVYVYAYTSTTSVSWSYAAYDTTDASGLYTITNLLAGNYYLKFDPLGSDYLTEYYNNKATLAGADAIPVALGGVVTGIDAAMDIGGKITGRVTAAGSGTPLQDVSILVYTSTTSASWSNVAYDSTDASGLYTITNLLAGNYYLKFDPPSGDYMEEYYDDKPTLASADAISVTLNSVVSNIDAVLKSASKITGRVTAMGSGAPLKDVDVIVYEYGCTCYCSYGWRGSATTDASGAYTVTGLLAGSYRVEFYPSSPGASAMYVGEYYNDKMSLSTADPVAVADSSVTSGIDAALALGGQIAGRITAADGGSPLRNVWVDAVDISGHFVNDGYTDVTGVYTITALPTGSYRVHISPSTSGASAAYLSEYYNNKSTLATADPVPVTAGGTTSNIDAVLDRGGQITGQVTAADGGAPLQDVSISVYDNNGSWRGSATTSASGVYTTPGLTTGNFRVKFGTQSASGVTEDYIDEYYNDKSSLATADAVPVTAPNLTSGINAVLARGGEISGQVTAGDTGGPLSGIEVSAYDSSGREVRYDSTDSSGNYSISGLPTGNYRVRFYGVCIYFSDSRTTKIYFGEYYNNKFDLATADWVPVTAPNSTSGINAVLGGGTLKYVYLPLVRR